jgi:hypothetical protein
LYIEKLLIAVECNLRHTREGSHLIRGQKVKAVLIRSK